MSRREAGIEVSDEAVARATGRGWAEWEALLDDAGAAEASHKEIAAILRGLGGLKREWWVQMVANGYEKLKGRRETGQTETGGFQIGVQRTFELPSAQAWKLVTSDEAVLEWLGPVNEFELREGEAYSSGAGLAGEVRVVRPGSHLRITRLPRGRSRASTIQVRVSARGPDRSVIGFHEENLPDASARERRRAHYRSALEALKGLAKRLSAT